MKRRQNFTLVEILIVIGIIAVLAGMLLAGLNAAQGKAEVGKAKSEIMNIKNAIAAFELEYNKLPKPLNDSTNKKYNGAVLKTTKEDPELQWLVLVLMGVDVTEEDDVKDQLKYIGYSSSEANSMASDIKDYGNPNKRKKAFLSNALLRDPWDDEFYQVIFESTYGGGIATDDVPGLVVASGTKIKESVIIWSKGSDGKTDSSATDDSNEDNVYSVDTTWSPQVGHKVAR